MENKKDCPMCKISDDAIKQLEQNENNKNNNNDSLKADSAAVRRTGLFGKFKQFFKK